MGIKAERTKKTSKTVEQREQEVREFLGGLTRQIQVFCRNQAEEFQVIASLQAFTLTKSVMGFSALKHGVGGLSAALDDLLKGLREPQH